MSEFRFETMADAVRYITAGKSTFTIVSKKTGTRYTYRASVPKNTTEETVATAPRFVAVLAGSDNESTYAFLGTLFPPNDRFPNAAFRVSPKARISPEAPSAVAAAWLFGAIAKGSDVLSSVEIWASSKCGRCGKTLTVPASVNQGFGPECVNKV